MEGFLTPAQVAERYAAAGAAKTRRAASELVLLGILAGMLIAFGSAATNTATYGIEDVWTARTVCGLLFPFGLGMVIVMGAELFTGNTLISISLLSGRCTPMGMLRNWILVYIGNFIGSILVAIGCVYFGQLNYGNGALAAYTMKVAAGKCALPFQNAFVLGILCNVLVTLAILMSFSGKDNISRLAGAYLPICFFVLMGFEHSVANMYYIGAGLLATTVPRYVEAAAGLDLSALTVSGFLVGNLIPVTLGNIVGGFAVGWLMWFCNLRQKAG